MRYRHFNSFFLVCWLVACSSLLLSSCAGLNATEQRVWSGAAIGGALGNPIGAGIGALIGYFVATGGRSDESRSSEAQ